MISHESVVVCHYCGAKHELATGLFQAESHKPEPSSVSLCIRCGKASVFSEQLELRKPTEDEASVLAIDPRIIEAQIVMAGFPRTGKATV
jgi:DNA-directed RNA polymerase subunit RPC12/RpoP